jgi:1D-myo-inositol 3-kinase
MSDLKNHIEKLTVVSVGHVTHDRYGQEITPGGCAFFGAKAVAALGANSRLLTRVGRDFICEKDLENLEVQRVVQGKTTVFTNTYPQGSLRVQLVESQAPSISSDEFPQKWSCPDMLFIAPVMGEMSAKDPWVSKIKAKFTAVGLQGFMKKGEDGSDGKRLVIKLPNPLDKSLFKGVDALFLSEEDIELFGQQDLLKTLRTEIPLVFVTKGEEGVDIYSKNKVESTGIYKTKTVDPTGAGDTFAAVTSLGLTAGLTPINAAKLGAAAASIVVEADGPKNIKSLNKTYSRYKKL